MKGQFCIVDNKTFCQEDSCDNCLIKIQHTCEDCGFVGMNVNEYDYQGESWVVCDSFKDCVARGSRKVVEENIAKSF